MNSFEESLANELEGCNEAALDYTRSCRPMSEEERSAFQIGFFYGAMWGAKRAVSLIKEED